MKLLDKVFMKNISKGKHIITEDYYGNRILIFIINELIKGKLMKKKENLHCLKLKLVKGNNFLKTFLKNNLYNN